MLRLFGHSNEDNREDRFQKRQDDRHSSRVAYSNRKRSGVAKKSSDDAFIDGKAEEFKADIADFERGLDNGGD